MINKDSIIEILKNCFDPEIPIDLWNLGLIYNVNYKNHKNGKTTVDITMTLTTPGCGMINVIAEDLKNKVAAINEVDKVNVNITFDPPWEPEMMTNEARMKLGFSKEDSSDNQGDWE